jgi:transcriptional repressor NrdR
MEKSIQLALRKRPVEEDKIDRMMNGIVRQLESRGESEIPTDVIGKLIMEALEHLDTVAYVRFASVYRDFTVAEDFKEFVGKITELQDEE